MWLLAVTINSLMAHPMFLHVYVHVFVHVHVHVYVFVMLSKLTAPAHLVVSEA